MHYELGPGEIVKVTPDGLDSAGRPPATKMKICAFLWTYYGYPNSNYEGINVEVMRYRNGEIMARNEMEAGHRAGRGLRGGRAGLRSCPTPSATPTESP